MQTIAEGSLLLGPAFPRDIMFYQPARNNTDLGIDASRLHSHHIREEQAAPMNPQLYWPTLWRGISTTQIRDPAGGDAPSKIVPASMMIPPKHALALENLAHEFVKLCTLDVKLGTVLYDENTSPEKKNA